MIVALPIHGVPDVIFSAANKKYKVGHAEIFVKDVTEKTSISEDGVTIGAWTSSGVSLNSLLNWRYESYVLGINKDKWKWSWKKGLHRVYTPVSNASKLADKAEKYKGCKYVEWYEFLTPKWVAPKRFTCTTLVWWCAKEVYDVKIITIDILILKISIICLQVEKLTEVYLFRVMMNIGILQMRIFIFSNQGH